MLPDEIKVKLPTLTLPTVWQSVIFRNYGYVGAERIALVLGCSLDTVCREAERMGLKNHGYSEDFEARGYITIIRNNWFLLPYSQIMTLLGIDEKRLDFILEKDDFLSVKFGNFKPLCEKVTYSPLSAEHIEKTEEICATLECYSDTFARAPFDFFEKSVLGEIARKKRGKRILHGYLSPCGDAFSTDCTDTLPDELLERYKASGVDGIWLHGVLSSLSYYPFLPELSVGFEEKRKNLNKIINRCEKYGISVYLYMNEPRALPAEVAPEFERLIGWQEKRTLCLSNDEVKDYLYNAVRELCSACPDLGGIFTITMSENPTHCHFLTNTDCPICKGIPAEKSTAEINNIMYRAMKDSGCRGEFIANLWGWSPYMGWSEEQIWRGIELLDSNIAVMCVSEYDLEIEKGGACSRVIDYSISNPGPSEITKKIIKKARDSGHKVYAKIQASNSWECAAVPYIPVFDLVHEHLKNLNELGVDDLFLTWTQGGYPSPSVSLACDFDRDFNIEAWYRERFGEDSTAVHGAIKTLCEAFREYPFSVQALYLSPHTLGSANLWDIEAEEKSSTMVCYAYDDYQSWVTPYGFEVYTSQLEKLLEGFKKGIKELKAARQTLEVKEILRYVEAVCCHFKADLLQTRFAFFKSLGDRSGMLDCVKEEKANAERLLHLMREDAKIGYEASNHYFYTERNLIEKIIRMSTFEKKLKSEMNG